MTESRTPRVISIYADECKRMSLQLIPDGDTLVTIEHVNEDTGECQVTDSFICDTASLRTLATAISGQAESPQIKCSQCGRVSDVDSAYGLIMRKEVAEVDRVCLECHYGTRVPSITYFPKMI